MELYLGSSKVKLLLANTFCNINIFNSVLLRLSDGSVLTDSNGYILTLKEGE